jgi:hypothetical protein
MEIGQWQLVDMTCLFPESHPSLRYRGPLPWTVLAVSSHALGVFMEHFFFFLPNVLGSLFLRPLGILLFYQNFSA